MSFMAACRPSFGDVNAFSVHITGLPARVFSQENGDFSSFEFTQLDIQFKASTSVATLSFIHVFSGSDRTIFLDDVRIELIPEPTPGIKPVASPVHPPPFF